ncbi:MAG TPA: hypothetical protein DHS57_03655 [Erysipelotrichaceae bacterium]|nr:hypothetical protein [Erysipelotrichaceae bacterium]
MKSLSRNKTRRKIKLISVFDYKTGNHVDINDVTAFFLKDGKVIALKYTTTNDVSKKMERYTDKCDVEVDFE